MAGTKEGGLRTAATNKKIYGPDYYVELGRRGGAYGKAQGVIKGFALDKNRARWAGRIGGTISKRKPKVVI